MMKYIIFLLATIVLIYGCKGKEPAKETAQPQEPGARTETVEVKKEAAPAMKVNRPPRVVSIDATPFYPKAGDTLIVSAKADDPDRDDVSLTYEWYKNNELLPETSNTLVFTKDFKRGDTITLNVIPDDGKIKGAPGMLRVDIADSPPEITSSAGDGRFEGRRFSYQVKAADKDEDTLSYALKEAPDGMTIDKTGGLVIWDVPADFKGKANVTVSVTDGYGGEAIQSFAVEVNP